MSEKKIVVLGLGYVGLPLALQLSFHFDVIGFDINPNRIRQLKKGVDSTLEVKKEYLLKQQKKKLYFTSNPADFKSYNYFIATVPTPIDKKNRPDLSYLLNVCKIIGPLIKKGDLVIFESTVYPGATEQICAPYLEKYSKNYKAGKDFFIGYSPERVNPGDKVHTIDKINKVISGQNSRVEKNLYDIYSKLTKGKIFVSKSIKVAEASKVIENAQRDINIAFINEVAKICAKLNISVYDVLEASSTKWNFLNFEPGLVGGHCIGVDPYYLAHKAKDLAIDPKVVLSGRETNDQMVNFIGEIISKKIKKKSKILFLGITFKEDVPDLRNSKSILLLKYLKKKKHQLVFYDPYVDKLEDFQGANFKKLKKNSLDAIILSVPHKIFIKITLDDIIPLLKKDGKFFDIKGKFRKKKLKNYWSL